MCFSTYKLNFLKETLLKIIYDLIFLKKCKKTNASKCEVAKAVLKHCSFTLFVTLKQIYKKKLRTLRLHIWYLGQ
jgi:hypothetical protein